MGSTVVGIQGTFMGEVGDFNANTYYGGASFTQGAGTVRTIQWDYPQGYAYLSYPANRAILGVRLAATLYASHNECISRFTAIGWTQVEVSGTTAYTTAYSSWYAPPANGTVYSINWQLDNRGRATSDSFRLIDAWVEISYADYPGQNGAGGDQNVTTPTFTMSASLNAIATGQNQFAIFQLATDAGFSNIFWQGNSGVVNSGVVNVTSPSVGPGTYYYRSLAQDDYGYQGGWSGTTTVGVTYPLPGTPTTVTPTGTVTVPNPTLGATLVAAQNSQTQRAEWQLATDSGFTANIRFITESTSDLRVSGATTEALTTAQLNLTNGTWYIRARAIDVYGQYTGWSSGTSFTVNVAAPPLPTAISVNSSGIASPTLLATVNAATNGRLSKVSWRMSKDSSFAAGSLIYTVTEPDSDRRTSGATQEATPSAIKLNNGTWYLQAKQIAEDLSESAWTSNYSWTVSLTPPPVPTSMSPANGSTVTTNTPTMGVILGAVADARTSKAEFQFATDVNFTQNVKTVTQSDQYLRASGQAYQEVPYASKITQQIWYWRARQVDQFGQTGNWTGYYSILPQHSPTSFSQWPTSGIWLQYVANMPFSWSFYDAWVYDTQRAYEILVSRNDTGAVVIDTGKIISNASQNVLVPISAAQKDYPLRWQVAVWDQDDVTSGFSTFFPFYVSDLPVITVTSPTNNQVIGTGRPTVTWTLDAGTTQYSYKLVFIRVSDSAVLHDSGTIIGTSLSYQPPITILTNNVSYRVDVTVTDTVSMTSTVQRLFSTSYQAPATVTYTADGSGYGTSGYVLIDWSQQGADSYWLSWVLYRRKTSETAWTLLKSWTDLNVRSYQDWTPVSGETYQYYVAQTANRSGITLESAPPSSPATVQTISTYYWLLHPTDPTKNFLLSNVTADSYTDIVESETYTVIGRGRRTDYGTDIGIAGSLTAQVRDKSGFTARQQKQLLEAMKRERITYQLRTPFGDIYNISMGDIGVSRIAGTGTSEFVDVTVAYTEVF